MLTVAPPNDLTLTASMINNGPTALGIPMSMIEMGRRTATERVKTALPYARGYDIGTVKAPSVWVHHFLA